MATATSSLFLADNLAGASASTQRVTLTQERARCSSNLPFSQGLSQVSLRHVSLPKVFLPARASPKTVPARASPKTAGRRRQVTAQITSSPPGTQKAIDIAKQVGIERTILLQGFRWFVWEEEKNSPDLQLKNRWWSILRSKLPDFQTAGFTHIWLPPPSNSAAPQGYMPGNWYSFKDSYGPESELAQLIEDLTRANIVPVCDIVINHRTGTSKDALGRWNVFTGPDGYQEIITSNDDKYPGTGAKDTGDDFGGAPDLDHTNPVVQKDVKDWLNWLITSKGYGGFRFDMVKGYKGSFLHDYVQASTGPGVYNVTEFWDGDRQNVVNYIDSEGGIATAFDFPLKYILQRAINNRDYSQLAINGQPAGLLGYWPQRATAFVDNHDTAVKKEDAFPPDHVITGYAYIFTHPCIPSVFWPHYIDWGLGAAINVLIQMRLRNNITANSKIVILAAESDFYVAKIDNAVVVKLGPRWQMGSLLPDPAQGWRLAASGTDYAIWDKTAPLRQHNVAGINMIPLL